MAPEKRDDIKNILNELNKAVKMHNFYPAGHPHFDRALSRCFQAVKNSLDIKNDIKFMVDHKGFYVDGEPLSEDLDGLHGLAEKFFLRRIKELSITDRVTEEDIKNLVFALRIEPEELIARGGVETFLAEKGVEGILLNEMRYEDLKRLKSELEEREEQSGLDEDAGGDETLAADEKAIKETAAEAEDEDAIESLIERLRGERDLLRYNDLSVRVREKAAHLVLAGALDRVTPAVLLLYNHAREDSGLQEDLRTIATEQLDIILRNDGLIRHLARLMTHSGDEEREPLKDCLLRAGDRAIEVLLDEAVAAEDAGARRNLFNTLLAFGERIVPYVTRGLDDKRWFAVRQMVSLLGELGNPAHIPLLKKAYKHEDIHIKKEVLKSLARLPSRESTELLLKALDEDDESLVSQAIVSLGVLREAAAVEPVGRIARTWEPFAERHVLQKEAIKALGNIGGDKAVADLKKIALRRSWFSRNINQELRRLAIEALGKVGSDDAYRAIEKTLGKSEGELYSICKRILEGREKNL